MLLHPVGALFTLMSSCSANRTGIGAWKTTSLATMAYAIDEPTRRHLRDTISMRQDLESVARKITVVMQDSPSGVLLTRYPALQPHEKTSHGAEPLVLPDDDVSRVSVPTIHAETMYHGERVEESDVTARRLVLEDDDTSENHEDGATVGWISHEDGYELPQIHGHSSRSSSALLPAWHSHGTSQQSSVSSLLPAVDRGRMVPIV